MEQLVKDDDKYDKLGSKIVSQIKTKKCRVVEIVSHHGLTESRFLARAKATNGLGTFTGVVWIKVLKVTEKNHACQNHIRTSTFVTRIFCFGP